MRLVITLFFLAITFNCFSQNITLNSQAEVDAFNPNITTYYGNIYIDGNDINDFSAFSNIDSLYGNIYIQDTDADTIDNCFTNLQYIDGFINIEYLWNINSIDGFNNLNYITNDFIVKLSPNLSSFNCLNSIDSIGGSCEFLGSDLINVDFLSTLIKVDGNLKIISGDFIQNFDGLNNLEKIGGLLQIQGNTTISNLDGFNSLESIGGIYFTDNDFTSISGFQNVTNGGSIYIATNLNLNSITGFNLSSLTSLSIVNNQMLSDISGFMNLPSAMDHIVIQYNTLLSDISIFQNIETAYTLRITNSPSIINLDVFSNLDTLNWQLRIESNDQLENIDGLYNLKHIDDALIITDNPNISNLNGLYNLDYVGAQLIINDNTNLTDCCGIQHLLYQPNSIGDTIIIYNNPFECNSTNSILNSSNCPLPSITGLTYWDQNNNQIYDEGEILIQGTISTLPETTAYLNFSNQYEIYLDSGNYIITYDSIPNWVLNSDSSSYHVQVNDTIVHSGYDFGFVPIDTISNMIGNMISPLTICDELIPFYFTYKNTGTTINSGKINVQIDNWINNIQFNGNLPDSIISNNEFLWCFDSLAPFQTISDTIFLQMPGVGNGFTLGDSIYINATVNYSNINDLDSTIQTIYLDYTPQILCAYDPNDKIVSPDRSGEENLTLFGEPLKYTIRFQNTGNYFATDVIIRDTLDDFLDASTIQVLSSSHPDILNTTIKDDKFLAFAFENIFLPDSTLDFEGSQGFVSFSILPKGDLLVNTEIINTAHIYFDSNPAIVTNTTRNTLTDEIILSAIDIVACDSFLFDNHYYYESEIVGDSLFAYDGYFLDLSNIYIEASYLEEINVDIEQGEVHTLPDGTEVSQAGSYSSEFMTDEGCDSIIITNVQVLTDIDELSNSQKFNLSPNPFSNSIQINSLENNNEDYNIIIYDILGRTVYSFTIVESKNIDTHKWENGVYQIMIFGKNDEQVIFQQKIVKVE